MIYTQKPAWDSSFHTPLAVWIFWLNKAKIWTRKLTFFWMIAHEQLPNKTTIKCPISYGTFFFPFFRGFYVETGYVLWDWPEQSTIVRLKKNRQTSPTYRTEKIAWVWLKKYILIFFLLTCDIIFKKKKCYWKHTFRNNFLFETFQGNPSSI